MMPLICTFSTGKLFTSWMTSRWISAFCSIGVLTTPLLWPAEGSPSSSRSEHPSSGVLIDFQQEGTRLEITLHTPRLKIRSAHPEDIDLYSQYLYGDSRVMEQVSYGVTKPREYVEWRMTDVWCKRLDEGNPFSAMVIFDREGSFVGHVMLRYPKLSPGQTEIHYLIAKEHQRKGYGTEAVGAMIQHLLPKLILEGYTIQRAPITRIIGTARVDNEGSNKILRKFLDYQKTELRYGALRCFYAKDTKILVEAYLQELKLQRGCSCKLYSMQRPEDEQPINLSTDRYTR